MTACRGGKGKLAESFHHAVSKPCSAPFLHGCRNKLTVRPTTPLLGRRPDLSSRPQLYCGAVSREQQDESSDRLGSEHKDTSEEQGQEEYLQESSAWRWEDSLDAVYAYASLMAILGLGLTPGAPNFALSPLFYFVGLAAATIYIGAHKSLSQKERQHLTFTEGALAPVYASVVLFGGYLLIKSFPDLSLQTFINFYFGALGSLAVSRAAQPFLTRLPFSDAFQFKLPRWLAQDQDGKEEEVSWTSFVGFALGLILVAADIMSGHQNYTLNNILACLIATDILQLLGLRTSKTAVLLLVGMLFYDIFWVFGSPNVVGDNVMETVATSNLIDGPFKLLFPRNTDGLNQAYPFALLGLGDVALPGLLLCLVLQYDASRSIDMKARAVAAAGAMEEALANLQPDASSNDIMEATQSAAFEAYDDVADKQQRQSSPTVGQPATTIPIMSNAILSSRTYFMPTMVAYVFGLFLAFAANSVTHLAQPALLYLVPLTLGTVCWKAVSRNELGRVWNFEDTTSVSPFKTAKEMKD